MLKDQSKTANLLQLPGLALKLLLRHRVGGLAPIAQLPHGLWGESQMAHDRDAAAYQTVNYLEGFRLSAFKLDPLTVGFLEKAPGGGYRPIRSALITEKGQIANHRRVLQAPLDSSSVVQHALKSDRQCCGVAQSHHGQ